MISLAGRDIAHAWSKFVFTGIGLGLLIGVTLTMAGVYRGMVESKTYCPRTGCSRGPDSLSVRPKGRLGSPRRW